MNTPLLLTGNWNEPFLLVACFGHVMLRCNISDGSLFADAAVWRQGKYLRKYDTGSNDMVSKMSRRFFEWARDGFNKPFGIDSAEANAFYRMLSFNASATGAGSRDNIDAIIRRWVLVDIIDPGMPIEVAHFDEHDPKRVRPRAAHNLPRDVRDAVDAYLMAYEPGHARAYVNSWKSAQERQP